MNKNKIDLKNNKLLSWINYQISWRRTYRALNALDNRTLDDLGIGRYQIREIARKCNM